MLPKILIDGNNLGHVLGYIDKESTHYDSASLLTHLDSLARYLSTQGHEVEIVLFLDDLTAAERLGGWHVQVATVPNGDADAAVRAYAQANADHPQILVSGDQALCDDVAVWSVVCLSPQAFITRYLFPARQAGFAGEDEEKKGRWDLSSTLEDLSNKKKPLTTKTPPVLAQIDQGEMDRQRQVAALERAEAILHGKPLPPPEVYTLDLGLWADAVDLALYLAEHHLCPDHSDLTDPNEMITAIRGHCCHQPRYYTSGRVINRVFRLFLCRPEHSLSLDDLAQFAKTRRRKIRATIKKHGEQLGIVVAW